MQRDVRHWCRARALLESQRHDYPSAAISPVALVNPVNRACQFRQSSVTSPSTQRHSRHADST
eukprot:4943069-Pleurochrysis_carterae.AAC.2